jgi:multidrug resistance protein, MATE family
MIFWSIGALLQCQARDHGSANFMSRAEPGLSSAPLIRPEISTIARHAGTVLVGQLAVMAFSITDTIVAGRFTDDALAALSIGASMMQALLPIYAELHGAQQYPQLGRTVRQSLYLAIVLIALGMVVMLFPQSILHLAQVPVQLMPMVQDYLSILAWALLPSVGFRMYSSLNQALGKPLFVTWLQVASLAVKIPLTIWLTFGGWGVPAMGLVGCAWATFIVNWFMLLCALWMLYAQPLYQPLQLVRAIEPPDWAQLKRFVRTGVPAGLAYLVEITSLTLMALFIARLGVVNSASHQIAANMVGVMYMLPLALSIACSARVSYWMGAGYAAQARSVAKLGLTMAAVMATLVSGTVLITATPLARLYSLNPSVVAMAASLLVWVAVYHWFDALQTLCAFVLRCYRVTVWPLLVYVVMLWGVGLYGGYALAYTDGPWGASLRSAQAFWITAASALGLVSVCLLWFFWRHVLQSSLRHTSTTD